MALQPHTFQRCKQWGAGCRVLALAHSCEERRGCGKDLEVGSADSSSCLILGTVSICAGGLAPSHRVQLDQNIDSGCRDF